LLDHLGIAQADLFGSASAAFVAYGGRAEARHRVGKLIVAWRQPPIARRAEESVPPTTTGCRQWPTYRPCATAYYNAVAPDPRQFDEFAAKNSTMVHESPEDRRAAVTAGGRTCDLRLTATFTVAGRGWKSSNSCRTRNSRYSLDHARRVTRRAGEGFSGDHAVP